MKPEMKKLIIANLPYLLFVYLFGKLGQAYRLAEGILSIDLNGFSRIVNRQITLKTISRFFLTAFFSF